MFECSFLASLTHWIDTKLSGWLRLIFTCKGQLKFIFVEQLDTVCGCCGIQGLYFAYSVASALFFPHSNPGIGHTDCINRRQRKKGHSCAWGKHLQYYCYYWTKCFNNDIVKKLLNRKSIRINLIECLRAYSFIRFLPVILDH